MLLLFVLVLITDFVDESKLLLLESSVEKIAGSLGRLL